VAQFKPIFTLNIAHDFFVDGRCTQLQFSPTAATERLLHRYQLLVRNNDTGFSLVADTDNWIEPDDEFVLRFHAFAQDKYFGFYTAESENSLAPLYANNKNITADNSALVLQRVVPPQLPGEYSGRAKPGTRTPTVIVDIDLNDAALRTAISGETLTRWFRFKTREIYWKYYFFGELAKLELDIHDLGSSDNIDFYQSDEPVAKNGKAFISQIPIAMNSEPKQRFQLKDKNNSGKILIKRLPSAGINLISKSRNLNGQQILVAEIYVNQ
jgi:hypothetical protein